jgi:predicted DsbA family dithiol-disulfide isomerase
MCDHDGVIGGASVAAQMRIPEIFEWAEYYCPWCYIGAVRLNAVMPEFEGRVKLRTRAFPLEIVGGGPPNRHELEQEWWLAALQEPRATFAPYRSDDWPTTTLPAFDAAVCAGRQGEAERHDIDLRIRRAFFAESRNIGRPEVMREIAEEAGLDLRRFERDMADPTLRAEVLDEAHRGYDAYDVRGTPTLMLENGTVLQHAFATADFEDDRISAVQPLPCCGDGCLDATRNLITMALEPAHASAQ